MSDTSNKLSNAILLNGISQHSPSRGMPDIATFVKSVNSILEKYDIDIEKEITKNDVCYLLHLKEYPEGAQKKEFNMWFHTLYPAGSIWDSQYDVDSALKSWDRNRVILEKDGWQFHVIPKASEKSASLNASLPPFPYIYVMMFRYIPNKEPKIKQSLADQLKTLLKRIYEYARLH